MADEQRRMTGADLVACESESNLSTAETANLLGIAARTVRSYRGADALPQAIAMALRQYSPVVRCLLRTTCRRVITRRGGQRERPPTSH